MNRSFKLALTQYKRELIALQNRSIKQSCRFVQTNIIPLVLKAWYASFLKSEKAKTAISKWGWKPLIYSLLDHPQLSSSIPSPSTPTNATATLTSTSDSSDLSVLANTAALRLGSTESVSGLFGQSMLHEDTFVSINKEGKKNNSYLDQIIVNEAQKEGRQRKLEEQQKEMTDRDANFLALITYTRVAGISGSLAKHNIYEIGAGLLDKVKEREETELRKKQRINTKMIERNNKSSVRFQTAFAKYRVSKTLTREDLVALINRTKF
jgi:hypothetical protein